MRLLSILTFTAGLTIIGSPVILFAQSEVGMRVQTLTILDSTPVNQGGPKVIGTANVQNGQTVAVNILLSVAGLPAPVLVAATPAGFTYSTPPYYFKDLDCSGVPYGGTATPPAALVSRGNPIGPQAALYMQVGTPPETLTVVASGGEGLCVPLTKPHVITAAAYQLVMRLGEIFTPPFVAQVSTY